MLGLSWVLLDFMDGFDFKVPATGKDDALAKEFWDTSEALLKEIGV